MIEVPVAADSFGMRARLLLLLALLSTVALGGGISLLIATRYEFTDCASGGSASQTVAGGTYFTRIIGEDVWVCYAATCATGGEVIPAGTVLMLTIAAGTTVSCRSATSTGDLVMTAANQ